MSDFLDGLYNMFSLNNAFAVFISSTASLIVHVFSWLFSEPTAWISVSTRMLEILIELAMWFLPDSADQHLIAFQTWLKGPVFAAMARLALWFISQGVDLVAFNACMVGQMLSFPAMLALRFSMWTYMMIRGSSSN